MCIVIPSLSLWVITEKLLMMRHILKAFVKCGNVVNLMLIGYVDKASFFGQFLLMNLPETEYTSRSWTIST